MTECVIVRTYLIGVMHYREYTTIEPPLLSEIWPPRHERNQQIPKQVCTFKIARIASKPRPQPIPPIHVLEPRRIETAKRPVNQIQLPIVTNKDITHVEVAVRERLRLRVVEWLRGYPDVEPGFDLHAHNMSVVVPFREICICVVGRPGMVQYSDHHFTQRWASFIARCKRAGNKGSGVANSA